MEKLPPKRVRSPLLRVVAPAMLGVALPVSLLLYKGQSWLLTTAIERLFVYKPDRQLTVTPAKMGMAFEELHLPTADGVTLHGWFLPRPGATWTCLYLHGNGGNIGERLDKMAMLQEAGCEVLLFDYRGYGRSTGLPDEQGLYRDAETAYRWLRESRGVPPERILVWGGSLGGAVALGLAERVPIGALVIESSFTSLADMARQRYPRLPMYLAAGGRYGSLARIGRIKAPKLIIHGMADETIPFAMGQRLFAAAPEPKWFYPIAGAGHGDTLSVGGQEYRQRLAAFLQTAR